MGLAAGSLVVAGALATLSVPLRAAAAAEVRVRAEHDLQAVQRLLAKAIRQAVPVAPGTPTLTVSDGGRSLLVHVPDDTGTVRAVAWRIAEGQVSSRLDGGGWQAVTDGRTLVVRDGRFQVDGGPAGGCDVATPVVRWSLQVRPAGDAALAWRQVDGTVQIRHPWVADPGCRP